MIKARFYKLTDFFWKHYIRLIIKNNFFEIKTHFENKIVINKSILIIGNHFSWWDGFIIYFINKIYFKKHFHVMMLEEELVKRKFLRTAGAFSIKKNSRESIHSINYSAEVLNKPQNMLLMFPQGKIESMHISHINFEKGIYKIVERLKGRVEIVFSVAMVEYLSNRKPTISIYLKTFDSENIPLTFLEKDYNNWYNYIKTKGIKGELITKKLF